MSDDDELKQVSHLVPKQLRDDAQENAEHGELSEAVRETYRIVAYGDEGDDVARLKQKLERAKQKRERLTAERGDIESEIADVDDRIASLESRIDDAETADEEYESVLSELEADIRDGLRVFEDHARVEEAAEIAGTTPAAVIDDLRERNPELPTEAFTSKLHSEVEWTGT